jgi:hypothetical protein
VFQCRVVSPLAVLLVRDGGDHVLDVWQQRCHGQPGDGGGDELVVDKRPRPVLRLIACEVDELGDERDV